VVLVFEGLFANLALVRPLSCRDTKREEPTG